MADDTREDKDDTLSGRRNETVGGTEGLACPMTHSFFGEQVGTADSKARALKNE